MQIKHIKHQTVTLKAGVCIQCISIFSVALKLQMERALRQVFSGLAGKRWPGTVIAFERRHTIDQPTLKQGEAAFPETLHHLTPGKSKGKTSYFLLKRI